MRINESLFRFGNKEERHGFLFRGNLTVKKADDTEYEEVDLEEILDEIDEEDEDEDI